MRLILAAMAVLGLTALPLLLVGFLDPSANPIGLGLLFVAGMAVALLLVVAAVVHAAWCRLHPRARR